MEGWSFFIGIVASALMSAQKQDHYAVLGLSHLRYKATPAQIKVARKYTLFQWLCCIIGNYIEPDRKKIIKHHPDKKAGVSASHSTNDDGFFKCIQKANEILTNSERRRQFDSVDPYYGALEEDAPSPADYKTAKDTEIEPKKFFAQFGPVFEREARFSKKTPVPMLGSFEDGKEAVESFYDFWYNFDSWRSFEYMDKEVNEGSDRCVSSVVFAPPKCSCAIQPR